MKLTALISALALVALAGIASAAILNVPDDYQTIQAGINASDDGDTVLVAPGTYEENIHFNGDDIIVASLFLTTGDTTYLDSTIIDGDANGQSVVVFRDGETSAAVLTGFTITNGSTDYGGGIYLNGASPVIRYNRVIGNEAEAQGGGIYSTSEAAPLLEHLLIADNAAGTCGGGISGYNNSTIIVRCSLISRNYCLVDGGGVHFALGCDARLSQVDIADNEAANNGGGIFLCGGSDCDIDSCRIRGNRAGRYGGGLCSYQTIATAVRTLIYRNEAESYGATAALFSRSDLSLGNCSASQNVSSSYSIYVMTSSLTAHNSILWENEGEEIYGNSADVVVAYCDIEGGREGVSGGDIHWLEGNIEADPLFIDPENGDYHLAGNSPCIDAGDPEGELDPDGTRADMGAFYFPQNGSLHCYVLDSFDGSPIDSALITTSFGDSGLTDVNGLLIFTHFRVNTDFSLTASRRGFVDSTAAGLQVACRETLRVDFSLWRPIPALWCENLNLTLAPGESADRWLTIANDGNYPLRWTLEKRIPDKPEPWTRIASLPVSGLLDDARIEGVVFTGDNFYVAGGDNQNEPNESVNYIYVLNRNGELTDTFAQPCSTRYGMIDLEWDGELLWGSGDRTIYGFTRGGVVKSQWEGPNRANQSIAWDSDRELLWISGITSSQIAGCTRDSNRVSELDQCGFRIRGLAYWHNDPDGYSLYILHSPDLESQVVHKMNPETGDTIYVTTLLPDDGGSPRGCFITNEYEPLDWEFISVADNGSSDRVDVWYMDSDPTFVVAEPDSGIVQPNGSEQEVTLHISAAGLDSGVYNAVIALDFPEIHLGGEIPLQLTVTPNAISDFAIRNSHLALGEAYPNPFNQTAAVSYQLSALSRVNLKLYDITGRLVQTLVDEVKPAGHHRVTIGGQAGTPAPLLPTGVYLLKLTVTEPLGGRTFSPPVKKVVCVR